MKKKELKSSSTKLEKELTKTLEIEKTYLKNLSNLKEKNLKDLNKLREILKSKEKNYQISLKREKENLNMNLTELENKELDKLKMKILENLPNSLQNLKKYSIRETYSMIGKKNKIIMRDTEKLMTALEMGLTKNGIKTSDFIEKMEKN
jgi:ABC-type phosphate transport system auxiliary subunit